MKHLRFAIILAAVACDSPVQSQPAVTSEQVEVALPEAPNGETIWYSYRQLGSQLKEQALRELGASSSDAIARIDVYRGETWRDYMLISAMSEGTGLFYIVPLQEGMLDGAPSDGKVTICRFQLKVGALPVGFVAGRSTTSILSLLPDPSCTPPNEDAYRRVLDAQRQQDLTGYRIYRRSEDGKAVIVSREDGGRIDPGAALQVAAGAYDPLRIAIPIPWRDWQGGYGETRDGRRLFYLLPAVSDVDLQTNCVVDGVGWSEFLSWSHAEIDSELKRFCKEGLVAEQAAADERMSRRLGEIRTPVTMQDMPRIR